MAKKAVIVGVNVMLPRSTGEWISSGCVNDAMDMAQLIGDLRLQTARHQDHNQFERHQHKYQTVAQLDVYRH
ncbi:MAG: hypothetical protein IPJ13_01520 [Saprospiraceae bacterium]|nr:hypothetical protein [Saprospiraceae bacterium]